MTEIHGKYADAKVYADIIDSASEGQIKALCDMPHVAESKIRIMPDLRSKNAEEWIIIWHMAWWILGELCIRKK